VFCASQQSVDSAISWDVNWLLFFVVVEVYSNAGGITLFVVGTGP
jgi:hypothetical protein